MLAQFCNFGESLDTMLRDRLVCGINDEAIQCCLLMEATSNLKKAFRVAQGMATASQNVHKMQGIPQAASSLVQSSEEVHAVSHKRNEFVCYRCGQRGHGLAQCSFRSAQCHKCGKLGHIK